MPASSLTSCNLEAETSAHESSVQPTDLHQPVAEGHCSTSSPSTFWAAFSMMPGVDISGPYRMTAVRRDRHQQHMHSSLPSLIHGCSQVETDLAASMCGTSTAASIAWPASSSQLREMLWDNSHCDQSRVCTPADWQLLHWCRGKQTEHAAELA